METETEKKRSIKMKEIGMRSTPVNRLVADMLVSLDDQKASVVKTKRNYDVSWYILEDLSPKDLEKVKEFVLSFEE